MTLSEKTDFNIVWWKSLLFRIPMVSLLLLVLLVFITYISLLYFIKPELEEKANLLYIKSGEQIVSSIYTQMATVETLARSIANAVVELPKDEKLIRTIVPKMLNLKARNNHFIAGGGVWPEPFVFSPDRERRSFFWGKDEDGQPRYFDDYNDPDGEGYHRQEWYVPVRYLPRNDVYWSKSYRDPYTLQPMVTVSVPMYRADRYEGVVTIDVYLGQLELLLREGSRLFDGDAFLLDHNLNFISRPHKLSGETEKRESFTEFVKQSPSYQPVINAIHLLNQRRIEQAQVKQTDTAELADKISHDGKEISQDESLLIASAIKSGKLHHTSDKYLFKEIYLASENSDAHLFGLPELDWYLVTVSPKAFWEQSFYNVIKSNFLAQIVGILLISTIGFLLMYRLLISPIKQISSQLKNSKDSMVTEAGFIRATGDNEIGAIAFWYNQKVIQNAQLNVSLNEKIIESESQRKALKSSEARFRRIIETSIDWIWQTDEQGNYTYSSPVVESLLGYTSREMIGKKAFDFVVSDKVDEIFHFFTDCAKNRQGFSDIEIPHVAKSGETVLLSSSAVPIIGENGQLTGFHGTNRDITLKKSAENLQKEKEIAERANQAKSEFLANISHELRTPMHGIVSFANLGMKNLAEKKSPEKLNKYFANIKTSCERLLNLLNDLLDLSKLESGKMEMFFSEANLETVAKNAISEQYARLIELDIELVWQADSIPGKGIFDATRMGQVITNFLSNAVKFTPAGKQIELSITETSLSQETESEPVAALMFSVKDEGIGIPEDELDSIFEKFVQSSTTKSSGEGTGLGLPICKQIIEAHSGKIWAENHPDGGAVFKFVIPVEQQQE